VRRVSRHFWVSGLLLHPFIYGAMGFITGAIGALIYNLIARWIGGIEIELQPARAAVAPVTVVGYFELENNRQYFYCTDHSPAYRSPALPG
jgi:hypothetical protein